MTCRCVLQKATNIQSSLWQNYRLYPYRPVFKEGTAENKTLFVLLRSYHAWLKSRGHIHVLDLYIARSHAGHNISKCFFLDLLFYDGQSLYKYIKLSLKKGCFWPTFQTRHRHSFSFHSFNQKRHVFPPPFTTKTKNKKQIRALYSHTQPQHLWNKQPWQLLQRSWSCCYNIYG